MSRISGFIFAVVAALAVTGASAHHSPAMLYDLSREITVEGVVTQYDLGNPHLRVYLDVDNAGVTEKWLAEGGSRTVLLRKGWDGMEMKPGDHVSIIGHPTRDGSNVIHMQYITLADGRKLFAEDLNAEALDERRRRE